MARLYIAAETPTTFCYSGATGAEFFPSPSPARPPPNDDSAVMDPNDSSVSRSHTGIARGAAWLHRYFLIVLLATYALAGLFPRPGTFIREFAVNLPGGGQERASMLLLAVLLFCAAAVIQWSQVRDLLERPSVLLLGLLTAWFGPALVVIIFSPLLSRLAMNDATGGMMVGFALVAAMPIANSSAGWTQNAGGNIALSLALVILSILLSPLATPNLLKLMGWVLSDADTIRIERVVTQFSGWRFILWVILPSLAGAAAAWKVGHQRITHAKPYFRVVTLVTILVLNYANASLAIDKVWISEPISVIVLAALMAASVSIVGILLATIQARLCGLTRPSWIALAFGLSMKHTGLALVLAGEYLQNQPRVILVVLLTTLAQHIAAAVLDLRLQLARSTTADFAQAAATEAPTTPSTP
jgi:bile acid:Na+ symporter, BASS family